jgi:hypothetical protein
MAAIDLIHFVFWMQPGIWQVPTHSNPRRSSLSQQPAFNAGGQL